MWREICADRLEAQVLTDLFAAGEIADAAEAEAAKTAAFQALNSLLRYRARIEREHRQAMEAQGTLRQRRLPRAAARPSEPEPIAAAQSLSLAPTPPRDTDDPRPADDRSSMPSEPERLLNRHQRRALQAMARQRRRLAA
jgi:hypothetical protein